jgi:hypothetical protein
MAFLTRWFTFLRERHEPVSISLMVAAFFAANGLLAAHGAGANPSWPRILGGYAVIWLIFLHMRMFDEVKDYAVDREHNPERPLARGLIELGEFGVMTLVVLLSELTIAANLGWGPFVTYIMVLCFTLMMRMEFFVGDWMRPKLELYAVTHTFSATMMGLFIAAAVTGQQPALLPLPVLQFALGNWFVFNVFEFGRKTFGREEERPGVDSYSQRLRPIGAVLLLVVNVAIAYGLLWMAVLGVFGQTVLPILAPAGLIALSVGLVGGIYALKGNATWAKAYRGAVTFYLLAYHVAIAGGAWYVLAGALP